MIKNTPKLKWEKVLKRDWGKCELEQNIWHACRLLQESGAKFDVRFLVPSGYFCIQNTDQDAVPELLINEHAKLGPVFERMTLVVEKGG